MRAGLSSPPDLREEIADWKVCATFGSLSVLQRCGHKIGQLLYMLTWHSELSVDVKFNAPDWRYGPVSVCSPIVER